MTINTFLLLLLVFAAYSNLYLSIKKRRPRKISKTELPISAKEWVDYKSEQQSYKVNDKDFKYWLKNNKNLEK